MPQHQHSARSGDFCNCLSTPSLEYYTNNIHNYHIPSEHAYTYTCILWIECAFFVAAAIASLLLHVSLFWFALDSVIFYIVRVYSIQRYLVWLFCSLSISNSNTFRNLIWYEKVHFNSFDLLWMCTQFALAKYFYNWKFFTIPQRSHNCSFEINFFSREYPLISCFCCLKIW